MEGGPLTGRNVFTLQFRGMNKSTDDVTLKSATIVSGIDETKLPLEIVIGNEIVPLADAGAIPPNAPITLVAKFGLPDPNAPGKILGLDHAAFLDKWRHFSFRAEDNVRKYDFPFTESSIAPFFPNMVGPRVSKKSSPGK